jgi:hypothetical protein
MAPVVVELFLGGLAVVRPGTGPAAPARASSATSPKITKTPKTVKKETCP